MRTLATLITILGMVFPSLAATTWPASTNANQTFFGTNTFTKPTFQNSTLNLSGLLNFSNDASISSDASEFGIYGTNDIRIYSILNPAARIFLESDGGVDVHGPQTNASSITATAFYGNGASLTGILPLAGGTITGPILSTSSSTNSPANTELASAGWIRGLFAGSGVSYYATTNIAVGFTNNTYAGGSNFVFTTDIPAYNFTRTYTTPANATYFGSVTTTNKFLQLNAGVTVNSYLSVDTGGSGTAGPAVKPEIYISYDGTNWSGDWDGPTQNIPEGTTNLYSWVISNPQYVSTNADGFYVQRRFKMVTQPTPTASSVTFHGGTNWQSHITLSAASSSSGNAYLAANQTFTGSNIFTGGIADAAGTYPTSTNVPTLNGTNVFTGTNVFSNPTVFSNSVRLSSSQALTLTSPNGSQGNIEYNNGSDFVIGGISAYTIGPRANASYDLASVGNNKWRDANFSRNVYSSNFLASGTLTATNGLIVPTKFSSPTNTPADGQFLIATGTGGATKWDTNLTVGTLTASEIIVNGTNSTTTVSNFVANGNITGATITATNGFIGNGDLLSGVDRLVWTTDKNAAGYNLTNVNNITATNLTVRGTGTNYIGDTVASSLSVTNTGVNYMGPTWVTNVFIPTGAAMPTGAATGGWMWNSNQVLYWVTSTKTNVINDGR